MLSVTCVEHSNVIKGVYASCGGNQTKKVKIEAMLDLIGNYQQTDGKYHSLSNDKPFGTIKRPLTQTLKPILSNILPNLWGVW